MSQKYPLKIVLEWDKRSLEKWSLSLLLLLFSHANVHNYKAPLFSRPLSLAFHFGGASSHVSANAKTEWPPPLNFHVLKYFVFVLSNSI